MSYKSVFLYGMAKRGFATCAALFLSVAFWATATPVINHINMDANKNNGQANGWIAIDGENFDGTTTTDVLFTANGGGTVVATNKFVSTGRGMIFCQIPVSAVTGNVIVRVDGVSSSGYPFTVNAGTFNPGSSTISGQVTSSGTPVPNADVALLAQGNCGHGVGFYYCAKTDSSGYYTLSWPGSGTNFMIIVLPPLSAGLAGTMTPVSGSGSFTQNFALTAGTTVTGTVHNPSGGALQNAYVSFDGNGYDQILTNGSGNFSLHLAPGNWTMYVEPPVGYHAMELNPNGVPVSVSGSSYSVGTKTLPGGIWFSGTLQDDSPTPQPVVAAELSVNPQYGGATYNANLSRPGGTFGIEVPSGVAFQLNIKTARKGPLVDWQGNYGPYTSDANIGTITLGHAGFITGMVTDDSVNLTPLSDVEPTAFDATNGSYLNNTNTCSDGSYILKVPAGPAVQVRVTATFWNDPRPYAQQTYNDKIFQCEGDVINVSGTSTVTGINFALHPGGSIAGKVTYYPGGAAVPNVNVQVDDGNPHNCALGGWPPTDSNGNYQFDHLPIMASRVWVGNQPNGYSKGSYLNKIYPDYTPVTPTAGTVTGNINIPLWTVNPLPPVPNGVGGSTSTAARITKLNTDASLVKATWDVTTCRPQSNENYSALFGLGSTLSSYGLVGSLCDIGTTGTYQNTLSNPFPAVPPGERFIWFVLVHTGGPGQTESSWGKASSGSERNGSNASNQCQNIHKDTSLTCP